MEIYGKGGIGASTTTTLFSVALSQKGYKVIQIACDHKADSTKFLVNGVKIPSVLDVMKEQTEAITLVQVVFTGFSGILCAAPGIG